MDIDDDEEEARAVHVDIADQPAMIDVTHDALNAGKGMIDMRCVMHRQNDTGDDHHHQRKPASEPRFQRYERFFGVGYSCISCAGN